MTTFIDTNVLIHVLNPEAEMHAWAVQQFEDRKALGPVIISDIVYCEFSVGMATKGDVDAALSTLAVERYSGSDEVLFRAGVAFKRYKGEHKGPKLNVLPDFLIGASAEIAGAPLLTTNRKDFLKYFPDIEVISPQAAEH